MSTSLNKSVITTITPYRGRADQLESWCKTLQSSYHPSVRHLLIAPGGLTPKERTLIPESGIKVLEPEDLDHGIMSMGHWHNYGVKYANTEWVMKLDVDCHPHRTFWDILISKLPETGWLNIGSYLLREDQKIPTPLLTTKYNELTSQCPEGPTGVHWVIRKKDYQNCHRGFVGYGWEDYYQYLMFDYHFTKTKPLNLNLGNITDYYREQSRILARKLDPRLGLLHKWHPPGGSKYKSQIEKNRRTLYREYLILGTPFGDWLKSLVDPVLVIGNGPIDESIIQKDWSTVIRINNYKLGYGTGDKITHWVTSCYRGKIESSWIEPHPGMVSMCPWPNPDADISPNNYKHILAWDSNAINKLPSTGICLLSLLHFYGIEHTITGFDGLMTGHYWDPEHVHSGHNPEQYLLNRYYHLGSSIEREDFMRLPNIPGIRQAPDGSFWHPRPSKELCKDLDSRYVKLDHNRWTLVASHTKSYKLLRPVFEGQTVYLVGKGPSLDKVEPGLFPDPKCPIIAINDSVTVIASLGLKNPLYGIQIDATDLGIKYQPMILESLCVSLYDAGYEFSRASLGLNNNALSAECALKILNLFNASEVIMIGFDAITDHKGGYAKKLGRPVKGDPDRFLLMTAAILKAAGDLKCTFLSESDFDRVLDTGERIVEPSLWDDPAQQALECSPEKLPVQSPHPQRASQLDH